MVQTAYSIKATLDHSAYQFTSFSKERSITKRIEFRRIDMMFRGNLVYNLAFGDEKGNGEIDDFIESNNGDIIRIIATVMASIYDYTSHFHNAIYFKGSNNQRTQFYQTILRRKYDLLTNEFEIFGINLKQEVEPFDLEATYCAFLIVRRLN